MRSWILAFALLIALIAAYAFYAIHAGGGAAAGERATARATATFVSVKDTYSGGTHSISGIVLAPDACAEAVATTTIADGIRVDVTVPASEGICLEVPTKEPFAASASGDADAVVSVYLDGVFATTTKGVPPPAKPAVKKK